MNKLFNNLSGHLAQLLAQQYSSLGQLFLFDRFLESSSVLLFAAGFSAGEIAIEAQAAIDLEETLQGSNLGLDLARGGVVTGSETGAGLGAIIAFLLDHGGAHAAADVAKHGTEGVRKTYEDVVEAMNEHVQDLHDRLNNLRTKYKQCCQ